MGEEEKVSEIQNYFEHKTVLLTGGTGFLGRLLMEKLLRTCNVKKLYITIRPKKNKDVHERLKECFNNEIFEHLKSKNSEVFNKIVAVSADVTKPYMGLSDRDNSVLKEEVNVVIHGAATISFDESLRVATDTNVRGTEEVLKLCTEVKNLSSVVYISTAYSFCVKSEVHELFYPPPLPSHQLINIVDAFSDQVLDGITQSIIGEWPNTYVCTKAVAEDCVKRLGSNLPVAVIRPSIVMSTVNEPIPGWIDRQLGVVQIMINIILGVIRTFLCNFKAVADIVPADYVINCVLAAAMRVSQQRTDNGPKHIPIYNCGTSCQNPITWGDCYKYLKLYGELIPSTSQVWKIFMVQCTNKYQYLALHFLLHLLPAFIVDSIGRCFGKESQLVKMYQKLHRFFMLIAHFSTNQWIFDDTNTQKLWRGLSEIDKRLYPFDVKDVNWNSYFLSFVLGCRKYLLKDSVEKIHQGRLKYLKLNVCHYTIITFVGLAILSLLIYIFC